MRIYKLRHSHPSITSLTELLGRKGDDQGHPRCKCLWSYNGSLGLTDSGRQDPM